jgi:uncharacterized RDD family membrane protein YckC
VSCPPGAIASRSQRLAGYAIDVLLVGGPFLAITLTTSDIDLRNRVFDTPVWVPWAAVSVRFLYTALMTAHDGQTVGRKVMRTRVVSLDTMEAPTLTTSSVRALPSMLDAIPLVGRLTLLVFVPVAVRSDRRGLHDLVAGTAVISTDF